VSGYNEVVAAHASRAKSLYGAKWGDLIAKSGLQIQDDGSNNARCLADAKKYLGAIEAQAGTVGVTSARLAMQNKANALGLDASF
jgi:hypothetical protein